MKLSARRTAASTSFGLSLSVEAFRGAIWYPSVQANTNRVMQFKLINHEPESGALIKSANS